MTLATGKGLVADALSATAGSPTLTLTATTVSVPNALTVTGDSSLAVLGVSSTLDVTGATTLGSTLAVTGGTTLSSTLSVTGGTTLSSTLSVTGLTTVGSLTGSSASFDSLSVTDSTTGDVLYTLPTTAGGDGEVLTSDAAGALSWTTPSSGGGVTPGTEGQILTTDSEGALAWDMPNSYLFLTAAEDIPKGAMVCVNSSGNLTKTVFEDYTYPAVGVTDSAVTAGSTVKVIRGGGISTGHTGLTPGRYMYLQADYSYDIEGANYAGLALTTTSMAVYGW
ncbi:hypothetical protein KIPB_008564 [Kipferlia bialata]|uniref:Uncharacterized protein n=1 Tax=Kipferlia bialata TaxID=797122 RepID=A0A9K3GJZ6_9EUKA|nr:hypothetical protein KIPB_008564 [Kipferlia bialata]|eukprot:g8564.t1